MESHASHKDEILQALSTIGQIRPSGSSTKPPTKTLKPIITDKEKQQLCFMALDFKCFRKTDVF